MKSYEGYERLEAVMQEALDQAAAGKGKERHANGSPFHEQRMQQIARLQGGVDGLVYQAIKKLTEGVKLGPVRGRADVLGAAVYAMGILVYWDNAAKDAASEPRCDDLGSSDAEVAGQPSVAQNGSQGVLEGGTDSGDLLQRLREDADKQISGQKQVDSEIDERILQEIERMRTRKPFDWREAELKRIAKEAQAADELTEAQAWLVSHTAGEINGAFDRGIDPYNSAAELHRIAKEWGYNLAEAVDVLATRRPGGVVY